jgi:hypothetical protein
MAEQSLLILDALGVIRFCNDPLLFGGGTEQLYGHPLTSLIPTLLLGDETPSYNIAYAEFWWADGPWKCHSLRTLDGRCQAVEVCLRAIVIDRKSMLLAILRSPPLPATESWEFARLLQSAGIWAGARLITALDGVAKYGNRAFEKLTGYGRRDIVGNDSAGAHFLATRRDTGEQRKYRPTGHPR